MRRTRLSSELDDLDRRIIGLLEMEGRISNAALAPELGVNEGTICRRLSRLIQEDVIRVPPAIDGHAELSAAPENGELQIEFCFEEVGHKALSVTGHYFFEVRVDFHVPRLDLYLGEGRAQASNSENNSK